MTIDGPYLFSLIDKYNDGALTNSHISIWLQNAVGFKLNEYESKLIFGRYAKQNKYSVNLGDFIDEVNPLPPASEGDDLQGEEEEEEDEQEISGEE